MRIRCLNIGIGLILLLSTIGTSLWGSSRCSTTTPFFARLKSLTDTISRSGESLCSIKAMRSLRVWILITAF